MGNGCKNGSVSEKVQKFGERSILMKWSLLHRGQSGNTFDFWFLNFFTWFLGGAKVQVEKSFFYEKKFKMDIG